VHATCGEDKLEAAAQQVSVLINQASACAVVESKWVDAPNQKFGEGGLEAAAKHVSAAIIVAAARRDKASLAHGGCNSQKQLYWLADVRLAAADMRNWGSSQPAARVHCRVPQQRQPYSPPGAAAATACAQTSKQRYAHKYSQLILLLLLAVYLQVC
jgi:hypothetical protein